MKIGLLTCVDFPNLSASDSHLINPLKDVGIEGVPIPWDSPKAEWRDYETLVIRSTWNYQHKLDEFLKWIQEVDREGINLHNPCAAIKWTYDKKYLHELKDSGVNLIPTEYVAQGSETFVSEIMEKNKWSDIVVKPSVGASAHGIKHLSDPVEAQFILDDILKNTGALIQPVMKSIYNGEWSLIFFNGVFSHSVLKMPGSGTIFVNAKYSGDWRHASANSKIVQTGEQIVDITKNLAGVDNLLYSRVDGLMENGKFTLMEIELIEPGVYLNPEVAPNFARAIREIMD